VNISADLVCGKMRDSKTQGLTKAVQMINAHTADLGDFLLATIRANYCPAI
jgi:two-component system NtrC family sensor kinase